MIVVLISGKKTSTYISKKKAQWILDNIVELGF